MSHREIQHYLTIMSEAERRHCRDELGWDPPRPCVEVATPASFNESELAIINDFDKKLRMQGDDNYKPKPKE